MISVLTLRGIGAPPNWYRVSFAAKKLQQLATLDVSSPFIGITPAVAVADEWILADATSPDGYGLLPLADGTASYAGGPTRQTWLNAIYDRSLRDWYVTDEAGDYFTIVINDAAPAQVGLIPTQQWYTHLAITPVIYGDYVVDADDVESLVNYSGTVPGGLTVNATHVYNPGEGNERTVKQLEGTPLTAGSGTITLTATDPYGGVLVLTGFNYVITEAVLVPVVDGGGTTLASALAQFAAAGLSLIDVVAAIDVVTAGNVFDQTPDGGTYVIPGTPAVLYVSGVTRPVTVGMTQADAIAAILAAGLTYSLSTDFSDEYAFGIVASQNPGAGIASPGETIFITVSVGMQVTSVTVRAYKPGFFGEYRYVGDTFTLSEPIQFSPYWMEWVDAIPANWVGQVAVFDDYIDREILEF